MKLDNYRFIDVKKDGTVGVYYYQHNTNNNIVCVGRCDKKLIVPEVAEPIEIKTSFGIVNVELNEGETVKIKASTNSVTISRGREAVFNMKVAQFRRKNRRAELKKQLKQERSLVNKVLNIFK